MEKKRSVNHFSRLRLHSVNFFACMGEGQPKMSSQIAHTWEHLTRLPNYVCPISQMDKGKITRSFFTYLFTLKGIWVKFDQLMMLRKCKMNLIQFMRLRIKIELEKTRKDVWFVVCIFLYIFI